MYRYESYPPQTPYASVICIIYRDKQTICHTADEDEAKLIVAALNEYDQPKDCDHCGIPIKREDIVPGAYGGTFCCDEHRQAYDKE